MPESAHTPVSHYKPSAFYFRRALRCAKDLATAKAVTLAIVDEIDHLAEWIVELNLFAPAGDYGRASVNAATRLADAREIGLTAVCALEDLKSRVREQGMIPPKWRVLESEAKAKGWGT